ncbi:MAG: branched-chain amino acid aminotransferase [Alphaproteobacteria bacterium]|nr:branched-chain amino acid aminotransferase [Alphaproteobacteria bacterium]
MALVPFHDREGWVWMDGEIIPQREAKVHLMTHALHYGSCVFEGERAYDGVVFRSAEHAQRLHQSARLLGFQIPFTAEEITAAKTAVLSKMGLETAYVRCLAWRGSEALGVSAKANTIHAAVCVWEWGSYFENKMTGIRMMVAPWRRPAPDTAPCEAKAAGLYMICTLSKHAAEDAGFQDALMMDWRGQIAEATGANIFLIRDGAIHTPTPDCFLNGITRQTVIKLARRRNLEVIERPIFPGELASFDEVFLTGSAAEVTPVNEIAGIKFKPGAVCETMLNDYANLVRGKLVL